MSKITYEEFQKRFELTKQFRSDALLKRNQYRDRLHRRNCLSLEYLDLREENRNKLFDQFSRLYNPNYSLQLNCYTERIYKNKSDLIFILDECDTLTKHLWDEITGKVLTLDFREILYLFKRISQILSYYHGLGYNHGDITEGSVYIDQRKQVRMMFFPKRKTNIEKAAFRISSGSSLQHTGYLLSPEQMDLLVNRMESNFDPNDVNIDKYKNDIFSLGLMVLRIISPEAFYQGYDLLNLRIDMKRLYTLVDTLGVFTNNHFMAMVRDCLSFDYRFRPTANFLLTEMEVFDRIGNRLKDKPKPRINEEAFLMHTDLYTGHKVAQIEEQPIISLENSQITEELNGSMDNSLLKRVDISHNFGSQLETIRTTLAPKRFSFKKNIGTIASLKKDCLHFLENDIYGNLAHRKAMHKPYGELTYKVKILNNNKKVGFILYPNGDIYFGYLRDLKRDDIGIYLLENGEVYHGEFRKGKIEGTGTYIFKNGDVFDGQWKDNLLHGTVKMFQKNTGDHYVCSFIKGHLANKTKNNLDVINSVGLEEFYKSFIMKTMIVRELVKDHILVNTQNLERNRQLRRVSRDNYNPEKVKFDRFNKISNAYLDMVTSAGKRRPNMKVIDENSKEFGSEEGLSSARRRKQASNDRLSHKDRQNEELDINSFDVGDAAKTIPHKMQKKSRNSGSRDSLSTNKKRLSKSIDSNLASSRLSKKSSKSKKSKKPNRSSIKNRKNNKIGSKPKSVKSKKSKKSQSGIDIDYKCLVGINDEYYEYEGGQKEGKPDGFGHFYFKNGCRFYGYFVDGLPHGKGTFFHKNGKHIDGVWLKGLHQGQDKHMSDKEAESATDGLDYLGGGEAEESKGTVNDFDTPEASQEATLSDSNNKLLKKYAEDSEESEDSDSDDDYLAGMSDDSEED